LVWDLEGEAVERGAGEVARGRGCEGEKLGS